VSRHQGIATFSLNVFQESGFF